MFGIKFIKVQPTTYLLQYRSGKIAREGVGLSFFYYSPTTSLVAVPVASTDNPFIFQETTGDFQNVTIQGQVTYRVNEPKRLAALLNYTLARDGETYVSEDPDKLPERVIHVINVLARAELQKLPLREAIRASDDLVKSVKAGLSASVEINSLGLEVLGLSILAIKPTPETARALEAETREKLFREADEAIYSRRNSAVEQERAIKENELNTEIAVENKKRQIRETQMEANRAVQEKENVLKKEALEANIGLEDRRKSLVALAAENANAEADARAYGVSSTMKALSTADAKILQALASTGMKTRAIDCLRFSRVGGQGRQNRSAQYFARSTARTPCSTCHPKMNRLTENKIVLVTRPTRLAELVIRFNTVSQARFYVEHQDANFSDYLHEDETYHRALVETQKILARIGRVQTVDRGFLPNFVFAPDDTIVTLGQDGLVANTLKYLEGQPVVGVNPDPARWDGKLLPFKVEDLSKVIPEVLSNRRPTRSVTMAKAALNNGQIIYAVNDLFIGPKSHTSARYIIRSGDSSEAQSSSGVIVSTGMGSTGWFKSLLTGAAAITQSAGSARTRQLIESLISKTPNQNQRSKIHLNVRTEFAWDAKYLFYTVREPFPTQTTGASLVYGRITSQTPLMLNSQMAENGVIFSDGIEKDFLEFNSGTRAVISIAERQGVLVQ